MKINSPAALELGWQILQQHGGNWSNVHSAGKMRPDGVIEVERQGAGSEQAPPLATPEEPKAK
ncbi:MAG: hypothetical protein ABUS57_02585 [Pseudomonadota bacterium]